MFNFLKSYRTMNLEDVTQLSNENSVTLIIVTRQF